MPRPTEKNRNNVLSQVLPPIRCTVEEKQKIYDLSQKAGLSISAYVREMAIKGKIVVRQNDVDFESVQQLRKLGINLNQQTKKLNATGIMPYELKSLWKKLDNLLDKLLEKV